MKGSLSKGQRILIALVCFGIALIGFMLKLPSAFRDIDSELHALFYFLAAAFLNVLFAGRRLLRHVLIFCFLAAFGVFVEFAQSYSNRFFKKRIHGRFDPEDVQWNLKGLMAFSVLWIIYVLVVLLFRKPKPEAAI